MDNLLCPLLAFLLGSVAMAIRRPAGEAGENERTRAHVCKAHRVALRTNARVSSFCLRVDKMCHRREQSCFSFVGTLGDLGTLT